MSVEHDLSEFNMLFVHSELDDYPLTPEEFRLYGHLARRAKDRKAYPGLESMAAKCRMHVDTARSVVRRLEAYGLIRIEERGKQGKPNVYHLTKRSAWKSEAEVMRLQEQFAAEGKAKRQQKKTRTPSLETTPPETKGGVGNEGTPPPRNEGRGGSETKGGEGGETKGPEVYPNKTIQQGNPDRQDKTDPEAEPSLVSSAGQEDDFEGVESGTAGGASAETADAAQHGQPTPSQAKNRPLAGVNGQASSTEKVPGGGATLAALTGALAPLKIHDLQDEYPFRALWTELSPERIRELATAAQLEHGKRKYRGALIDALDEEVRIVHAERLQAQPQAPPLSDDDVDMDALFRIAPLNGYSQRRRS